MRDTYIQCNENDFKERIWWRKLEKTDGKKINL